MSSPTVHSISILREYCITTPTNKTKETHDTAEDLYNEDLHKQIGVGSVREGGRGACNAHRDATEKVARADGQTSPEERVPCEHN